MTSHLIPSRTFDSFSLTYRFLFHNSLLISTISVSISHVDASSFLDSILSMAFSIFFSWSLLFVSKCLSVFLSFIDITRVVVGSSILSSLTNLLRLLLLRALYDYPIELQISCEDNWGSGVSTKSSYFFGL